MTIITTVSGKRIRLRPKKSGPKPLPEGVKKRRINICLSLHWHKVGKEKAAALERAIARREKGESVLYQGKLTL